MRRGRWSPSTACPPAYCPRAGRRLAHARAHGALRAPAVSRRGKFRAARRNERDEAARAGRGRAERVGEVVARRRLQRVICVAAHGCGGIQEALLRARRQVGVAAEVGVGRRDGGRDGVDRTQPVGLRTERRAPPVPVLHQQLERDEVAVARRAYTARHDALEHRAAAVGCRKAAAVARARAAGGAPVA
eukprot:360197-Chlamydomonas_euryale.AAC.1